MAESLARARANLNYCFKAQIERYNNSTRRISVASFRSYLNVLIAEHRKALVRLLTYCILLPWQAECHCPSLPCSQCSCHFCHSQAEVEDRAHVFVVWRITILGRICDSTYFNLLSSLPPAILQIYCNQWPLVLKSYMSYWEQIISKLLDLSLNVFNVFHNAHF